MNIRTVEKSLHIWYSAEQMYDLVSDVPNYVHFLPWCGQARILQQYPDGVTAELQIRLPGISPSFTTRNTQTRPHTIHMRLVDGPFSLLEGDWSFQALPTDPSAQACKIDFELRYAFASKTLQTLIGPMFDKIATTLVDAFIARAQKIYG